jgi:PEP-CTERM motif
MNTTKSVRFPLPLVATLTLLAITPMLRADSIITMHLNDIAGTGSFNPGTPAWQTFTVTQPGILTTIAMTLHLGPNDSGHPTHLPPSGFEELYAGIGTSSTMLTRVSAASTYVSYSLAQGYVYAYVADFGGISLTNGQYTISYVDEDYGLFFPISSNTVSAGGYYYYNGFKTSNTLTLNTPYTPASVPEPSSFALLAIGGLVLGGYAWRKKKQTA